MGRVRKKSDQWMPSRVYRGKSAYEWRPKGGGCIRLCDLDVKRSVVHRRYEEEVTRRKSSGSFSELVRRYFSSSFFNNELKPRTQKDYKAYWRRQVKDVFGSANPRKITRQHIVAYMNFRKEQMLKAGQKFHQANREKAFISGVFSWAMQRELHDLPFNPCKGVKPLKEESRTRYIEDWEYKLVYKECTPVLAGAMEVAYLCASRVQDVSGLKREDIRDEGIYINQGKTDVKQIKKWTPRLRKAIDDALAAHRNKRITTVSPYIFNSHRGTRFTPNGLSRMWAKRRDEAAAKYNAETGKAHKFDFTFHDLKAKGISDYTGDKKKFSGHKTDRQVDTYDRRVPMVDIIDKEM